ncbi:hypothetical protein Acr_09g0010370 [Actinidia rufa]|uniref:Uncharacterized protein n=1 Tax=Actinidia rufa TaxID=165716 RepID=A0A7J0F7J4_9ERIC|nr:hypothetical protein Acr_09g0010370 [Actinidia rufa]
MMLVRAPRAPRGLTDRGLELVLGHNNWYQSQVQVTGEPPEQILNAEQIRSAQNQRLSIPPDSSLRFEAPAPNRFKIGLQTTPHAPPEAREGLYSSRIYERVSEERSKKRPDKRSQEEVKRRGQRRGLKKEVTEVRKRGIEKVKEEMLADDDGGQNPEVASAFIATRRDKKNCPRNKA